jgi:hypothetical protein
MAIFDDIAKNPNVKGITTAAQVLLLYVKAQELGVGFGNAIDHMHIINGKTGIDIHIAKAILLKAGKEIRWEKTMDYLPHYKYSDGSDSWISPLKPRKFIEWLKVEDPFYEGAMYVYDGASGKEAKESKAIGIFNVDGADYVKMQVQAIMADTAMKPEAKTNAINSIKTKLIVHDYITEYKFTREVIFGRNEEIILKTETSRFSKRDGYKSGKCKDLDKYGEPNTSSPWIAYNAIMVDHKAWFPGGRAIGDDLLMGCYETKELYDIEGYDYQTNDAGQVTNIDSLQDNAPAK